MNSNQKLFTWIIGISALFIAGNAALFSVTGLGQLFSKSMLAVIFMASSLEIGKLVAASYLHRYWNYTAKWIRGYLIVAIISLMVITSAGIFGFLSNAYEQTAISLETQQRQIELLESKKNLLGQDIPDWRERIANLTELRNKQEVRIDTLIQKRWFLSLRNTEEFIRNADAEITDLRNKIGIRTDSILSLEIQILEEKNKGSEQARDIGGFRFVAKTFDMEIDVVVKWFMFILIFVFDPLAIVLILSWQTALEKQRKEKSGQSSIYENIKDVVLSPSEPAKVITDDMGTASSKNNEIVLDNEETIEDIISAVDTPPIKKSFKEKALSLFSGKSMKQEPDGDIKKEPWRSPKFNWGNQAAWKNDPAAVDYYKKYIV